MVTSPPLTVLLDGQVVAEVGRTRAGVMRLTFTDPARSAGRTPLSLSLPSATGAVTGQKVEWFLQGLLPDSEAARRAIARTYGADPNDVLSLLGAVGKDCAGSVQLCRPDDVEATLGREGDLIPVSTSDIEMRLAGFKTDEDAGWTMPGEHWSLGGSQQKFALRRQGETWFEATGSEPTSHIIKPGIYKLTSQALVEHVSMRAADRCGISTAATEYTSFKSEDAIVITRFDRAPARDGGLRRLHQEDLCQALGVSEKSESEGGPGAREIIQLLRDASSTSSEAQKNVTQFVDGLIYNVVIAGPDAHARNYAVLLDGDSVQLAPLFDVASGLAYTATGRGSHTLSMSIGGVFDTEQIDTEAWKRFADENALDDAAVVSRVAEVAGLAPEAMGSVLAEVDDWDGSASQLAARLLPAAQERARSLAAVS
ncbi:type II toxin-antitoxin system HipA family toxin [Sanguibacter sp. 25GB23B1]|uniref:type II toxin-antitoxin system HipA family toxin n=1 Tax=unclassified Sanguibacter TaxID=2645534 RepID=UPI0032AEA92F